MGAVLGLVRRPWVQRGVRAAVAAGLAWQFAVLLPPLLSEYAYYAPLGAVIAVHPTIADSASAAWRTGVAILFGFALALGVYELTRALPTALTIALIVALAVVVEQWPLLREQASWVSFAAVLMVTVGAGEPGPYVLRYAGLTVFGAAVGVLVTTVLFPPLQLTYAVQSIGRSRELLAAHLRGTAAELRHGYVPGAPALADDRTLSAELDRMRAAEALVERARRANPRARNWRGRAEGIRDETRALDRVAVLIDDLTELVSEFRPHRRGLDRVDSGTGWVLADTLDALAGVVCAPYHTGDGMEPDERDRSIQSAQQALDRLIRLLRTAEVPDQEGYFALSAVAVGVRRSMTALGAEVSLGSAG